LCESTDILPLKRKKKGMTKCYICTSPPTPAPLLSRNSVINIKCPRSQVLLYAFTPAYISPPTPRQPVRKMTSWAIFLETSVADMLACQKNLQPPSCPGLGKTILAPHPAIVACDCSRSRTQPSTAGLISPRPFYPANRALSCCRTGHLVGSGSILRPGLASFVPSYIMAGVVRQRSCSGSKAERPSPRRWRTVVGR
jgi:hypothetical protein